jgi:DNA-3-methyladenine glycosylase
MLVFLYPTQAMGIEKSNGDRVDLTTCGYLWIEDGPPIADVDVVCCSRIGIKNYAGDWTDKPMRFYLRGNKSVSVRNRQAERAALPLETDAVVVLFG